MDRIIKLKSQAKKLAKDKDIKIKAALEILAQENHFPNWKIYKNATDTFWYQKSSPFINHWFARRIDAQEHQQLNGGFLLPYKGQYFIAEKEYIEHVGLDPENPIWKIINFDVSTSSALNKVVKALAVNTNI